MIGWGIVILASAVTSFTLGVAFARGVGMCGGFLW